uniref:N protein n=1 Tax=Solanum tuberosum TaxID=4113 RepID=M1BEE5_SOLTU
MLRGLFIFEGEPVSTRHWCGCGCGVRVGFGQSDPDTLTRAEKKLGKEISFRRPL